MNNSFVRLNSLLVIFMFCTVFAQSQNRPVGYWRSHLPYNNGVGIATDGTNVYALCPQAFFSLNGSAPYTSAVTYSKVEGMSDIGMQCSAYDYVTGTLILVYTDGNIDLYKIKESTFYNVADLKIKSISGSKAVNMVYAENGVAYFATSVGVLVLDLTSRNFTETYQFNINSRVIPVNGFVGSGSYFYTITAAGVYRAPKNNPQLQNFQVWQLVDSATSYKAIASVNSTLFLSTQKKVNALVNDSIVTVYTCLDTNNASIQHIDSGKDGLLISSFYANVFKGSVIRLNGAFSVADSFVAGHPLQAVELSDGSIWVADAYYGLGRKVDNSVREEFFNPPGPSGPYSFDIYANNKDLWIAHGGYNQDFFASPSFQGVSNLNNEKWTLYRAGLYHPLDTVDDFVAVVKDEATGTVYMGSFLEGLFTLHSDGSYSIINANSVFDSSNAFFGHNQRQVFSLALDVSGNLWVTLEGARHQLYVKTPDSNWYKYYIPGNLSGGPLVIDDYGQVWFASLSVPGGVGGIGVYNTNGTFSNTGDDVYYHLTNGVGNGNLPSNTVLCLAKDQNNSIWIGTDNGICIESNCSVTAGNAPCDAQIPIVQYDQFAGYLFAGNSVRTIAVDGANRKWVGTDAGVWLLSPNASSIVYRFTIDNSPLPSNLIKKIAIDKVTGDVYIGTDQGLVSFRSTATNGDSSNHNEEIFPNPVPGGYTGTIAIKGLVANADVRITDIDGQLVYKTTALGGQAVWNGKDYKGHRPQSGVYLVFVSSSDGAQTYTGKIIFLQ